MAGKVTTAWGSAVVLDEISLPQSAADKEFVSLVQLLSDADGERYVRFAYTTDGVSRRGPVTLREGDLELLHAELAERPELAAALGLPAAASRRGGGLRRRRS
jgi:hypothetical protein